MRTVLLTLTDEMYDRLEAHAAVDDDDINDVARSCFLAGLLFYDFEEDALEAHCPRHPATSHPISRNFDCARNLSIKDMATEVLAHVSKTDELAENRLRETRVTMIDDMQAVLEMYKNHQS